MSQVDLRRRDLLKGALLGGVGAWTAPQIAWSAEKEEPAGISMPRPAEIKVLNSKEYGKRRIRRVQQAIKQHGLDGLIISNRSLDHISYVSNYHPRPLEQAVALVPAEGSPTLLIQMMASMLVQAAKRKIWIEDVVEVPFDPWSESTSLPFYEMLVEKIKTGKMARGRFGLAGGEVDWMLPYYFGSVLPGAKTEDANALLFSMLIVKDEIEVALMRHSQKISDKVVYPLFRKLLVPGALDREIFAETFSTMLRAGADINSRMFFGAGPYNTGTGSEGVEDRRIQRGDIVLLEPIARVEGYQTEKNFTFAVGKDFPESQIRGAQVAYEAFLIGLNEMKPGKELRPVFEKADKFIKSRGYLKGSTYGIGHWIGFDTYHTHQGPRITIDGTKGVILEPGMVISWHPYLVEAGKVKTCSSSCILITEKGAEKMSKIPDEPMYYV